MTYDLVIRNGNFIDGTGAPGRSGVVAIRNGKGVMTSDEIDGLDRLGREPGSRRLRQRRVAHHRERDPSLP